MRIAVISPHPDDAVFSVGEHMLSRPGDQFTIISPCGWPPAEEPDHSKYEQIMAEHYAVVKRGGWDYVCGNFADDGAVSRGNDEGMRSMVDQAQVIEFFTEHLQRTGDNSFRDTFDEWWVPMGIHHLDHRHVRAALGRIGRPTARWKMYEELPYRVLHPDEAASKRAVGAELEGFGPLGPQLEAKRRLCALYASQMGETEERCLFVPERLWRMQ